MRVLLTVSLLFSGALTAVVVGGATPASAQPSVTLYVVPSGSGDCTSLVNACGSIQTAINAAEGGTYNGDDVTIDVAAGTYTENDSINPSTLNSLTIAGAGASSTTVNGNAAGNVFSVGGDDPVTISGLTLENGGSGINENAYGLVTVLDSTITDNIGGGAIYAYETTNVVIDSTISDNVNYGSGGGINVFNAPITVTDSTISGNSASDGAGAIDSCDDSQLTLTDSTVSGNSGGAAIVTDGSSTADIGASIMANNTGGPECSGPFTDEGYNIADDDSCAFGAATSTNSSPSLDASLGALADNGGPTQTILPSPTSPAVGAIPTGTTLNAVQVCSRTDQRGVASFGHCTIGAVEVGDASLFVAVGGSGDCTSLANACGSVQTAITTAQSGTYNGDDVGINVAAGTYTEADTIDASSLDSLTIAGAGASSTTVDGTGSASEPVFLVNNGTVAFSDIAIDNNDEVGGNSVGSGIDACDGSSGSSGSDDCVITVTDSSFSDDEATDGGNYGIGGAIAVATTGGGTGSLTVNGSTFSDDFGQTDGGAIDICDGGDVGLVDTGCDLTVAGSTFTGDTSYYGAGAINSGGNPYGNGTSAGTASVTDSTFTDNSSVGDGAIASGEGTGGSGSLTVAGSTFSGNSAGIGGAIANASNGGSGTATVSSSTFIDNTVGVGTCNVCSAGGAIANAYDNNSGGSGTLTVSDSTFVGNAAEEADPGDGGAIDNGGGGTGTATITSSTFSGNTAANGGAIGNFGGTVDLEASTLSGNAAQHGGSIYASSPLSLGATILANSPSGGECDFENNSFTDEGYNIDDDGSCTLSGTSISHSPTLDSTLGAFKQNAGPTETILPDSDSPAVGVIPNNTTLGATQVCPTTDQQGVTTGPGAPCNIGATQTSFAAPTVSAVTFGGTAAAPTVTVWGSGLGTESDLGTAAPAACSATGSDYANTLIFADSTASWGAGTAPGDCIGLVVSSYSDNQIAFTFGSGLNHYGTLADGDSISVTVLGTSYTGTASFGSHAQGTPPYAYVANYGAGTVTPISTATGTADTPITVGTHPDAIAVTPDGTTAFVANQGSGTVSPIATATNARGTAISVGASPDAIAITPNGQTAYVANYGDGTVTPIATATNTAGTPISVGTGPSAIAISPDGQTAYVTISGSDEVVPIATATNTVGTPISVGDDPVAIAITPDGTAAYVANALDGSVTPIDLASQTTEPAIIVGEVEPTGIAITPDGQTAYVTDNGNTINPIDLATQTVGTYIAVGNDPSAVAVSPDGSTAYVANYSDGTVTPVATATGTANAPITVGNGPRAVAVMPDQGPAATLAATTTGSTTTFDATTSVPGSSPIVSYAWNFGDGNTATTSTATTTHTYGAGVCAGTVASPACAATVTLTDAVGASTTQVFTGQTVGLNGSGVATASTNVVIATTGCTADNSCAAAVTAPATASAPAQAVTVTVPSGGSAQGTLTVTTGSAQLNCSSKGFKVVASNVTSYSSTFVPSTNVDVTDFITGPTRTRGIKICFEGPTPPPTYLKKCAAHNPVAPCATLAVEPGGVQATILVPGGDPRFRIDGVQTITENPTAVTTKGKIGKTITIKGTDLLGITGQSRPKVAFTSLGGSTIAGPVTKATATSITVQVPNGAATGAVSIAWPDETMVSEGSITIT